MIRLASKFTVLLGLLLLGGLQLVHAGPEPKTHPTLTTVSCTPDPTGLFSVATCTITVTDLGGQGPDTPPAGSVTLSSSGTGTFSASSCTLVASTANASSCSVTYTPTVFGTGTHTITANYAGGSDPNPSTGIIFTASSGNYPLALSYPAPTIVSISPNIGLRGQTSSVTVTGTGFVAAGTSLNFGSNITQSNFTVVNSTTITVDLTIAMAAATGSRNVTVTNPSPGGGSSTLVNGYDVRNPAPTITTLTPAAVDVGSGAVVVTIDGTGFVSDSVAYFNGTSRTTAFVNTTQLTISLTAADTSTVGSYPITVVNPTPGGGTSGAANFAVSSTGGSFDIVEPAGAIGDAIYLKLAGVAFDIDILATDVGRTSIDTTFTGTVKVELLDASDDSGSLGASGCRSSWTVADTLSNQTFAGGDNGRIAVNYSQASALRVARFRVTYPASGPVEKIGCSSDAFSNRPTGLTLTSSMNNGGFVGAPGLGAGDDFTMTATAIAGYDGTPQVDGTEMAAHVGAITTGTLSGSFAAATVGTGVATGTFQYDEVGAFRFEVNGSTAAGIYDDSFTAIDQASDCTDDFSNSLSGGQYGCKFGNTSNTQWVGRFTPSYFDVEIDDACTDASGFTYSGQPFALITISAMNLNGTVTENYDFIDSPGTLDDDSHYSNDVTLSFGGSSTEFSPTAVSYVDFDSGVFSATTVSYTFDDPETVYTDVSPRAGDADSVTSSGHLEETTEVRSGRISVGDSTSITILDADSTFQVETWQETSPGVFEWSAHTDDTSCTTVVQADFSLGSYTGDLGSGETSISAFSYTAPSGTVTLSAPGSGNAGSVELTLDLSTQDWLQFDFDGDTTPEDPVGVISFFEIFETEPGFINKREVIP